MFKLGSTEYLCRGWIVDQIAIWYSAK